MPAMLATVIQTRPESVAEMISAAPRNLPKA